MANIIVRGGDATKRSITGLFTPPSVVLLVAGMTDAIAESFGSHSMRNVTEQEKKRRFDILMRNTLELRGERKWGVQRIVDAMPDILKAELDGGKYQPDDKRQCWVASDGS